MRWRAPLGPRLGLGHERASDQAAERRVEVVEQTQLALVDLSSTEHAATWR